MDIAQKRREFSERQTELTGLLRQEALSAGEQTRADALIGECEALQAEIEAAGNLDTRRERALALGKWAEGSANKTQFSGKGGSGEARDHQAALQELAGTDAPAILHGRTKVFKSYGQRTGAHQAYRFGMWVLGGPCKNPGAAAYCKKHGLQTEFWQENSESFLHQEGVNSQGGFLVPQEFSTTLIDLREQYGVFRRNAKVEPMGSDTKWVPRRTGGLTAYYVAEGAAITESTKSWDRVNLVAKKLGALVKITSEVNEDAIIDIGSDLASEVAYAFARAEDDAGFLGDGTSTYGGIVGLSGKFLGLTATRADIAGLVVASGNLFSEITLNDFLAVVGKLPRYADDNSVKWYMHRSILYNAAIRTALAAGGVTMAEIINGARNPTFLGYPVEITQAMPSTDANDQIVAYLGDLSRASMLGDRRHLTMALSTELFFAEDEIALRGTQRFDINTHDVGNSSATAASRVPGPIVGLLMAAS